MKYMMATKAIHQMGDISRDEPSLCLIYDEEEPENYIGNWVEGFGFINVRFPKATTRELTEEEINEYDGQHLKIGSSPAGTIRIKG